MHAKYIGEVMTYEQAYFALEGYNFVMTDLEANERGINYKGRIICISNETDALVEALNSQNGNPWALRQGKMEDIDVPEVTLGRLLVHG